MRTWNNSGTGGGSGTTIIVSALNVVADRTVVIPANHTVLNVVVKCVDVSALGGNTLISIGDNAPDYDNYVPEQLATPLVVIGNTNTITIGQTPDGATILTIHSAAWRNEYNFYFTLNDYV